VCCNCGNLFPTSQGRVRKKSLTSKIGLKKLDTSFKRVIEDVYCVTLTPEEKKTRFLCEPCSWSIVSLAKIKDAELTVRRRSIKHGYLAKKLRSPSLTPRRVKRPRLTSPLKVRLVGI